MVQCDVVDNYNVDNYNDDLIITKKDGSVEYQVQAIGDEQNGYKLIFKTSYKSILKATSFHYLSQCLKGSAYRL